MSERAAAAKRVLRRKRKQIAQKTRELRTHLGLRTAIAQQKFLEVSILCIIKISFCVSAVTSNLCRFIITKTIYCKIATITKGPTSLKETVGRKNYKKENTL